MATTRSMTQLYNERIKKQEENLQENIKNELQSEFITFLENEELAVAKMKILDNKFNIIKNISIKILKNIDNFKDLNLTEFKLGEKIEENFLKEFKNMTLYYKEQQKAKKEYYKILIYDKIRKDIKLALNFNNIDDIMINIYKNEFKEELFNVLNEKENIDLNLFNEVYYTSLNKAAREFKQDRQNYLEEQKVKEQLKKQQQKARQQKNKKIPLGWKIYGSSVAFKKLFK